MKKVLIVNLIMVIIMSVFCNVDAATINDSKWNLHFENIEVTEGSVEATLDPTIEEGSNTEITYSVYLNTPGEFYEFTADVVNAGSLDAMVNEINGAMLTEEQEKYLTYEVTYMDGTEIKPNDKLRAGTTEKLRIRLEYKKDITADDLPKEDTTLTLSLNTYYVQADSSATEKENDEAIDNNSNNTKNDIDSDVIKNSKTGDIIITYVAIFIIALIALVITKKKSNKEDEKNLKK